MKPVQHGDVFESKAVRDPWRKVKVLRTEQFRGETMVVVENLKSGRVSTMAAWRLLERFRKIEPASPAPATAGVPAPVE